MYPSAFFISRTFSILRQTQFSSHQYINAKIKTLVQDGLYQRALESYSKEPNFPKNTSPFTFPSLLKACALLSNFQYGGTLQSAVIKLGLHFDPYIITSLVRMCVKSGSLSSAVKLFDDMSQCQVLVPDSAIWNCIIDGFSKNGFFEEGMIQFRRMQAFNVKPDGYTLSILLGICNDFMGISYGKEVHCYLVRHAFDNDPFVITAMIDMYSNSNRPIEAWNVFDKLDNKYNVAIWNSMINGFCENGLWRNSLQLYPLAKGGGLDLGSTTFASVFTACSQGEDRDFGSQLHCDVVKTGFESDSYVSTSLLTFYSKCGILEDAKRVFLLARDREVGLWNSLISAYINHGSPSDALNLYAQMSSRQIGPDSFTISNALIACSMIELCNLGMMIHCELMKKPSKESVLVESALLTMYSKLGSLGNAYKVFSEMKEKDVVAWGSMISGSCANKKFVKALDLYKAMESDGVQPDSNIIASVITACTGQGNENLGRCFHGLSIKDGSDLDAFTGRALIEFYSRFRQPEMAKNAFSNVLKRNLVVWNSLMSCYSQNGLPDVAISLLPQILQDRFHLDSVSITIVLAAVSQMATLLKGKTVHGYHIRLQLPKDIQVENALIDMYIKCGCFSYAQRIFNMSKRDVVAWNSMISGYGSHGECRKAIDLFNEMINSGASPDEVTFLSLISSCNHCGFVDEGLNLFGSLKEHKIEPKMEHYVNIVDLLGRGGRLDDALVFIENMGMTPERGVWLSLLSACRVHRNIEMGEFAADKLIKMDPERGSNYVQLLNLYVEGGLKEKAANLRVVMREKGLMKSPGCSWIEVKNKVEVFFSGDSLSPGRGTMNIYEILHSLGNNSMKIEECNHEY